MSIYLSFNWDRKLERHLHRDSPQAEVGHRHTEGDLGDLGDREEAISVQEDETVRTQANDDDD